MGKPMSEKMAAMLEKLGDPDEIKYFQDKWNEYVAANEHYERVYDQQFGNQVMGNRSFGEQKQIQTPPEQMRSYESLVMTELSERVGDKEAIGKEEIFEREEPGLSPENDVKDGPAEQEMEDFQLTFDNMDIAEGVEQGPVADKATHDLDRSQELMVSWIHEYEEKESKAQPEQQQEKDIPEQQYEYELELNFGNLDEPGMEDIEPEAPGMDEFADD
jgi:hypothetical protein